MAEGSRNRDRHSGKPPGKTDSSSTGDKGEQNDGSLASRIQESASGLARNAFYAPGTPQEIARTLPGASKAGGAASSASFGQSSSQTVADQYRQSSGSSSARGHGTEIPSETFRSSTAQQGQFGLPPFTEEEFQHTHDSDIHDSFHGDPDVGEGKGKARDEAWSAPDSSDFDTAWQRSSIETTTPAPSQAPPDGAAVISLLSDRTFDPEFPASANEPFEPVETELSPPTLTAAEVQMIEQFRRQLPAPEQSAHQSQPSKINPTSLIPDINNFLDGVSAGPGTDATALRDDVLTNLPGSADWITVEERYHDEVWGYLRPTLEAAAKEIEDSKDSETTEDGPAVRRLKMILKHMQG